MKYNNKATIKHELFIIEIVDILKKKIYVIILEKLRILLYLPFPVSRFNLE